MNIPGKLNRLIGQAIHSYNMLADGDRLLIAVSGGIDSLVLSMVLHNWRKKAPINYELELVHIDMGVKEPPTESINQQLARYNLSVERVDQKTFSGNATLDAAGNTCFQCSRNRRTKLFSLARERGCNKLALGHHRDDLIETFFINVLYSGNISTMVPAQPLFNGDLTVIRPLAFLSKEEVKELGEIFRLTPAAGDCPLSITTKRDAVREILADLSSSDPAVKGNIFNALSNVREDYLLKT
ncbi:MAG: ATP-binding protein [Desulfurivibrionaceae bacterium]